MAKFTVNGRAVTVENNQKLLRYLRDTLHLTSVKDGCSEGACGTCTVLIDGKPTKACIPQTDKLEGKSIVTVEGLTDFEKQVYTYAFGMAGAVQCGFCIPGMVMSAKGLLDMNPNPTREEAAYAIRNNICRCTGYVKIIDAILLAAELFRKGEVPPAPADWSLGQRVPRVDVEEKVTGTGIYPDDIYLDGMIYGSAVRSQYPRARVLAIHTEEARALPGVVGVFTAEDIPGQNKVGHLVKDWDTMIAVGDITHYLGDAICLVAAETPEILAQAKALVKVDYEELPMVRSPREAMLPDAPLVHRTGNLLTHKHIQRGNPAEAIAKSKHVLTQHFSTPWTEHAFLEPECAVAYPDGDGVMILSTDQGAYDTQHETMGMLGLPAEKVKVRNCLVGGGFGGKEDVTVQHHAALIAYLTKRPVKVKLTRAESILIHPKRHPMEMEFSIGCDENGIIQGVAAEVIADTGAYASLGGPVLERACTHAAGPYNYQNFEIDGWAYYTNNPPAGAFRGFGVTQTCFCIESLLNQMADIVGITPWEIRYRNAIRPGQELPNGQIVDNSTGLVETLEAVKPYVENNQYVGLACAMKNAGVGVGIPDTGRCRLVVEDGRLHIFAGASCIGRPGHGADTDGLRADGHSPGQDRLRAVQHLLRAGLRHHLRLPPDAVHRRGGPPGLPGSEGGHGGLRRSGRPERSGVLWRIPGKDGPSGGPGAQPRQPRGLRLRHPGVHPGRRGENPPDGGCPRCGQGRESPVHRGADRGRRGDEHGLCPDGAVSPHGLQAHRQIRHAGPVPGQPDPGDHPHHRGKSGTERGLRRHRYRRDHLHPHSPSHCGRLLPLRRQVPYQSAPGGHALQP